MIRPYPVPLIEEDPEPVDPFELWPDLPRREEERPEGLGIRGLLERSDHPRLGQPHWRRRRRAA